MKLEEVKLTKEEMAVISGMPLFAQPSSDAKIMLDRINESIAGMDALIPIGDKIRKALAKEAV